MRYLVLVIGVGLAYLIFTGMAKSQEIPPTACEESVGQMMEIAGKYITKEAVANQKIEDLKTIIQELQNDQHQAH